MRFLFLIFLIILTESIIAQTFTQYFDGADTNDSNSLFFQIDTITPNTWVIGTPNKSYFNSASSAPNALVTDTLNAIPNNDSSYVILEFPDEHLFFANIIALQWRQKLDFQQNGEGGVIEFSTDNGATWENAFDNNYVENFYGYQSSNVYTLYNGKKAFSGLDTIWRNIWICFDYSWVFSGSQNFKMRFTSYSDPINSNNDGWIMDNFILSGTFVHTVNDKEQEKYMVVNSDSKGGIKISTKRTDSFHIIESIDVIDIMGKTVDSYSRCPTNFAIDIGNQSNGTYLLKIKTNIKTETFKVVVHN